MKKTICHYHFTHRYVGIDPVKVAIMFTIGMGSAFLVGYVLGTIAAIS